MLLSACGADETNRIYISAASSLQEVMVDLVAEFNVAHPEIDVHVNFGGSSGLQVQIREGFPVDVFLSAHPGPIETLNREGLVTMHAPFATSQVVLITTNPEMTDIYDLASENITLTLANREVPIGFYAHEILENIDLNQPGFLAAVEENVTTYAMNVRQAMSHVTLGESDATFVYTTDIRGAVDFYVIEIPEVYAGVPIFYVALINRDTVTSNGEDFYRFMLSNVAQEVLVRHGFNEN